MGYQTNYIPNESPENSRQENLNIFKNRHIHKKFHIKVFVRKNSTGRFWSLQTLDHTLILYWHF
jgi:hypothetical protein